MGDIRRGTEFKVLDHGYIKVVDWMGSDEDIISAARMSTGKGFISWDPYEGAKQGDAGLLKYLYKNCHLTPFEMCELSIEVQTPIFVAREWMRHRTQSYNEFSGRYAEMPNIFYVPEVSRIQKQDLTNKQASSTGFEGQAGEEIQANFFEHEADNPRFTYEQLLKMGVARELARINLPLSQYTRFRAKANLRNWLAFLLLRMAPGAQYEIRRYALMVAEIVKALWPRTYALFVEHDLLAKRLGKTEVNLLLQIVGYALAKSKGEKTTDLTELESEAAWVLMRRLAQ